MSRVQLAIIGGGLVGASLALALQAGARARVLATFAEYGNLGFGPAELAHLAGVSTAVVKGLETQGVILREAAPRDAPPPLGHANLDRGGRIQGQARAVGERHRSHFAPLGRIKAR